MPSSLKFIVLYFILAGFLDGAMPSSAISSLSSIVFYSILAIIFYAEQQPENPTKEDIWTRRIIGILLAVIILSCLPWFFAELSHSTARWPRILHNVVMVSFLLTAWILYRKTKGK